MFVFCSNQWLNEKFEFYTCSLNEFCALCEIRESLFVDGGAGIGDESHFKSLGKAGGTAEIFQFGQNTGGDCGGVNGES